MILLFNEMRRIKKLMTQEDTAQILKKAEYGTLASMGKDGYPYSVPFNFTYIKDCIYFHSAHNGHKIENIKNNAKVSFSAVNYVRLIPQNFDTEYDSVVIFGSAVEVTDDEEKQQALLELIKKYSKDYLETGMVHINKNMNSVAVYKIKIDHMTGKRGR